MKEIPAWLRRVEKLTFAGPRRSSTKRRFGSPTGAQFLFKHVGTASLSQPVSFVFWLQETKVIATTAKWRRSGGSGAASNRSHRDFGGVLS